MSPYEPDGPTKSSPSFFGGMFKKFIEKPGPKKIGQDHEAVDVEGRLKSRTYQTGALDREAVLSRSRACLMEDEQRMGNASAFSMALDPHRRRASTCVLPDYAYAPGDSPKAQRIPASELQGPRLPLAQRAPPPLLEPEVPLPPRVPASPPHKPHPPPALKSAMASSSSLHGSSATAKPNRHSNGGGAGVMDSCESILADVAAALHGATARTSNNRRTTFDSDFDAMLHGGPQQQQQQQQQACHRSSSPSLSASRLTVPMSPQVSSSATSRPPAGAAPQGTTTPYSQPVSQYQHFFYRDSNGGTTTELPPQPPAGGSSRTGSGTLLGAAGREKAVTDARRAPSDCGNMSSSSYQSDQLPAHPGAHPRPLRHVKATGLSAPVSPNASSELAGSLTHERSYGRAHLPSDSGVVLGAMGEPTGAVRPPRHGRRGCDSDSINLPPVVPASGGSARAQEQAPPRHLRPSVSFSRDIPEAHTLRPVVSFSRDLVQEPSQHKLKPSVSFARELAPPERVLQPSAPPVVKPPRALQAATSFTYKSHPAANLIEQSAPSASASSTVWRFGERGAPNAAEVRSQVGVHL